MKKASWKQEGMTISKASRKFSAEIEGIVFEDRNKNGFHDPDEPGIPDVAVILVKNFQKRRSTTDGTFAFTDVEPGDHAVGLDEFSLPEGYQLTTESTVLVPVLEADRAFVEFGVQAVPLPISIMLPMISLMSQVCAMPPPPAFTATVQTVTFSGDQFHAVKRDDGGEYSQNPHWQANPSISSPVAFVRNSTMKITATFRLDPAPPAGTQLFIQGDGPDDLDFPATQATIFGNTATITNVGCTHKFANQVGIVDPLRIEWKYSLTGAANSWTSAGTSENQAYVTLNAPITTPKPTVAPSVPTHPIYHSLIDLGCRSANGATSERDTLAKVWEPFSQKTVYRVDHTQLTYYQTGPYSSPWTAGLLQSGDGSCGAWVKLFLDTLRIQGLTYSNPIHLVYTAEQRHDGFLVRRWNRIHTGASVYQLYKNLNIYLNDNEIDSTQLQPGFTDYPDYFPYQWKYRELEDDAGLAGQGNANPYSMFKMHEIVLVRGDYYDPSYGEKYGSLEEMANKVIEGFFQYKDQVSFNEAGANVDFNEDGKYETILVNRRSVLLDRKEVDRTGLTVPPGGIHDY